VAVFTEVSFDEAAALLKRLNAGELTRLTGIAAGIENTNYFAEAPGGHFVITVFERLSQLELGFYLQLMKHLARQQLPVPDPLTDDAGEMVHRLAGKPAAIVNRLPGAPQPLPTLAHAAQVARALARTHLAGDGFPWTQPNPRGLAWWTQTTPGLLPLLDPAQRVVLEAELQFQQQLATTPAYLALPRGPIHADLFRDNVLFADGQLTGLIDFYFAGVDTFLFDIAVCLNDWCSDAATGQLFEDRAADFMAAYADVRALEAEERQLLPALMRASALRFWISRLYDRHVPRAAALLEAHDPSEFERVLHARIDHPWTLAR
jgi:homoserine kinase type II